MKKSVLLIILLTALLCSCSLAIKDKGEQDIYFFSCAANYYGTKNALDGPINDQNFLYDQLRLLCMESGKKMNAVLVTQGTVDDEYKNSGGAISRTVYTSDFGENTEIIEDTSFIDLFTQEFEHFLTLPDSDDILIFQYSGHGYVDSGDLYLPGGDFTLKRLSQMLGMNDCFQFIILDSCFSGNAAGYPSVLDRQSFSDSLKSLFSEGNVKTQKTFILTGSQMNESSFTVEVDEIPIGFLTYYLLDVLGFDFESISPALPQMSVITTSNIIEYCMTQDYHNWQHPQNSYTFSDFILFEF